jgi:hypothetical protein
LREQIYSDFVAHSRSKILDGCQVYLCQASEYEFKSLAALIENSSIYGGAELNNARLGNEIKSNPNFLNNLFNHFIKHFITISRDILYGKLVKINKKMNH